MLNIETSAEFTTSHKMASMHSYENESIGVLKYLLSSYGDDFGCLSNEIPSPYELRKWINLNLDDPNSEHNI